MIEKQFKISFYFWSQYGKIIIMYPNKIEVKNKYDIGSLSGIYEYLIKNTIKLNKYHILKHRLPKL